MLKTEQYLSAKPEQAFKVGYLKGVTSIHVKLVEWGKVSY